MWGCAAVTLSQNLRQFQAGAERLERRFRQGVHVGSDYRMTHWKVEKSMKSRLTGC